MPVRALPVALAACAVAGAAFAQSPVVLRGDNGYRPMVRSFPEGSVIDARGATWRLNNSRNPSPTPGQTCKVGNQPTNPYPLRIKDAHGGMLLGGHIIGEVPFASAHMDTYCNSAGVMVQSADFTVRGLRVDQAWDAIRPQPPRGSVRLEKVWVNAARDDCVENDKLTSLEIVDSLLDRCFVGVSLDPACQRCEPPAGPRRYRLDRVLLRLTPYPLTTAEGGVQHKSGAFLKVARPTPAAIEVTNSVFAFEDIRPNEYGRVKDGWRLMRRCSNNRLLYLGGEALPKTFPLPPACFTVVTGAQARREWERARAGWLAAYRAG